MARKKSKSKRKRSANKRASGDRRPSACSPSYYTFRNHEGKTFQLRGDLTMEDLLRMGYTDFGFAQPEAPLAPDEWRCDSIPENVKCAPTGAIERKLK